MAGQHICNWSWRWKSQTPIFWDEPIITHTWWMWSLLLDLSSSSSLLANHRRVAINPATPLYIRAANQGAAKINPWTVWNFNQSVFTSCYLHTQHFTQVSPGEPYSSNRMCTPKWTLLSGFPPRNFLTGNLFMELKHDCIITGSWDSLQFNINTHWQMTNDGHLFQFMDGGRLIRYPPPPQPWNKDIQWGLPGIKFD